MSADCALLHASGQVSSDAVSADRLLVGCVEDDPILSVLLVDLLSQAGYDVVASDGSSRDGLMQGEPPIVLLDLGLPPMPHVPDVGLALLTRLLECSWAPKVIVLTGQHDQATAFEALSRGAFDFLAKPAGAEAILSAVRRAELFYRQRQHQRQQGIHDIHFHIAEDAGLKQVRNEAERRLFADVWQQTGGNVHETARRLGIKRENVYYLMDKFGISRDPT